MINQLHISAGNIRRRSGWIKSQTLTFVSDTINDISPFVVKHLNPALFDPANDYVSGNGEFSSLTVSGSTWAEIDTVVQALKTEFNAKFSAFSSAQDLASAPVGEIINL